MAVSGSCILGAMSRLSILLSSLAPLAVVAACGDDAGLPDARPPIDAPDSGQISLTWSLSHGGLPQTCASVGATSVVVEIIPIDQPFGVVDSFGCSTGMGVTRDLAPNQYDLRVSVTGGGTLDGPTLLDNIEVRPNMVTATSPLAFDVEPTGTLAFRITTPPTGGNCAPAASMGAGITTTTLELRDAAGTCVPTTFQIAAGAANPAGTYASDCTGTPYPACIAADQDVTAEGVQSGQHSMLVTGSIAGAPCWSRNDAFSVRAGGLTTTLNPQLLMYDDQVPGCPML